MAHTYDTKANIARINSDPITTNYTCGADATLLILSLVIGGSTDRTGGAPTYNSIAFTQAGTNQKAASSPETVVELWYLLNPPTGSSYQISIPNSGTVYITSEISSYKAASGYNSKLKETSSATGTSTNPTGPTHTGLFSGDVLVAVVGSGGDSWNGTANKTSLYTVDNGTYGNASQYFLSISTTNTALSWTFATSEDWAICSVSFTEIHFGINVSVAVGYGVLKPPEAVNVSVLTSYAVLDNFPVNVSKANIYSVIGPVDSERPIAISKANIYAVLYEVSPSVSPSVSASISASACISPSVSDSISSSVSESSSPSA